MSRSPQRQQRVVVIGAGPTALGAICRLADLKFSGVDIEITVVEKENKPGGLGSTITDEYGFSWDMGVHITGASKHKSFMQTVKSVVPEWHWIQRNVKADMKHVIKADDPAANYVPYPVQSAVPYFPEPIKSQCLAEQLSSKNEDVKFDTFDDFSLHMFGPTLQKIFIRPYNLKVWTVPLSEMNFRWAEGRVPKVDVDSLINRCNLDPDNLVKVDSERDNVYFRYPADCIGMGELWQRVVDRYPTTWFKFGQSVKAIDTNAKKINISSLDGKEHETIEYDILISTMPLTELCHMAGLFPKLHLAHSKVALIGIGLCCPQSEFAQTLSWAYFPEPEVPFYRCTVVSNFSPCLVPDANQFWSVLCEIGLAPEKPFDANQLTASTIQSLVDRGIITSAEQVHSVWTHCLWHGYPVPSVNRDDELARAHAFLEARDIFSRGRFGGWKYESSNQDCSFEIGKEIVDRLFVGVKEDIYDTGLPSLATNDCTANRE